jgi:hypothetical protein
MPQGVFNRAADNWRPLVAIAAVAGGDWPDRARKAAADACGAETGDDGSQLELLLADIRDIRDGDDSAPGVTEITSADLIARLVGIVPRPWAEYGRSGKPITQNRLARILKPLGITSELLGGGRLHGYRLEHFADAFDRYLSPLSPPATAQLLITLINRALLALLQPLTPEPKERLQNRRSPITTGL